VHVAREQWHRRRRQRLCGAIKTSVDAARRSKLNALPRFISSSDGAVLHECVGVREAVDRDVACDVQPHDATTLT
jgi:hypothetical protein